MSVRARVCVCFKKFAHNRFRFSPSCANKNARSAHYYLLLSMLIFFMCSKTQCSQYRRSQCIGQFLKVPPLFSKSTDVPTAQEVLAGRD